MQAFYGDGTNPRKVYDALRENSIWSIIPLRKNATIKQHGNASAVTLERDECIRQIWRDGRKAWRVSW